MSIVLQRTFVRPLVAVVLALQVLIFKVAIAVAQDVPKQVDVNVDVKNPTAGAAWYGNWWVWAIGVAVFLIIVVALTNRGDRTVVRE